MLVARIAVLGAGAVGCTLAAGLLHAGLPVRVCRRTPFDLLRVRIGTVQIDRGVEAWRHPDEASPVDVIVLAVKAHETAGAAPWLARLVARGTKLVVAQNGVEQERAGDHAAGCVLLPAVVDCPAERLGERRSRAAVRGGDPAAWSRGGRAAHGPAPRVPPRRWPR